MRIDPELAGIFPDTLDDGHVLDEEGGQEDALSKFFYTSALEADGVNVEQLAHSLAPVHSAIDGHYKALAASAAPAEVNDPQLIAKRFSQPDPRNAYREYFREQLAKGKSAAEILDAWCVEFPHRNPSVEKLMVEVSKEFA
jgi:hypothetical protein